MTKHICKLYLILVFCIFSISSIYSQQGLPAPHKGNLYFYWGWNTSAFTRSDLHFKGANHNFTLKKITASDRQTKFSLDSYLNPGNITTPQFNFRIGYYLNDHYSISFGLDHMKYVMDQDQVVKISGSIQAGSKYDGTYKNSDITVYSDFLKFEHTNGLNYSNLELRRIGELLSLNHLKINFISGIGAGILLPRTDATLLNNKEYDEFHLAGYGIAGLAAINFTFFNSFFIQSELKGGFIDMPDIRTTINKTDKASQQFWFRQTNVAFGANIRLARKNK